MKERKVKIALVQLESIPGQISANTDKICKFTREAAEQGAALIVFPELAITGYYLDRIKNNPEKLFLSPEDPCILRIQKTADECGINIIFGCPLKRNGRYTNSALIIDESGSICSVHDKVFLWKEEKELFVAGRSFRPSKLSFGVVGTMICYDAGFPESARELALQGAEVLVVPAAFAEFSRHRWNIYFQSRALENTCYVAAVNGAGGVGEGACFGNNLLFDPQGMLLVSGVEHSEQLLLAEIDLSQADKEAKKENYIGDLMPLIDKFNAVETNEYAK